MLKLPPKYNTKIAPLMIIALAAVVIGLMFAFKPTPEKKENGTQATLVDTLTVKPATLSPTLTLFGRIESPHTTTLSAATSAFVDQVIAYEGQQVKKGDLLVTLDNTDAKLLLAQREADLQDISAQLAQQENRHQSDLTALKLEKELLQLSNKAASRYENLVKKNVGSDIQRDDALQSAKRQALSVNNRQLAVLDHPNQRQRLQAQQKRAEAMRDQAALDLARTQISAPFNGRVTAVMVSPRNRLRQSDPIITLYATDSIEVRAQIPARYLPDIRLAINQGLNLTGNILIDGQQIPVTMKRLAGNVSESKGGVDGFFEFQKGHPALEVGRATELHLTLAPVENAIALPPMALYGQSRIYSVNQSGVLQSIDIKRAGEFTLKSGEPWILVVGDIPANTQVLTTQLPNAISGLSVSVNHNEPTE